MNIQYLQREEIDNKKWDECISHSSNRLVYAYTWFLDIACKDWSAIILDDYKALLPLPLEKFWFWKQVKLPELIPELGIITKEPIDSKLYEQMLKSIPFLFVNITMNAHNQLQQNLVSNYKKYRVLDLIQSKEHILSTTNETLNEVFNKYNKKHITVVRSPTVAEYLRFNNTHANEPVIDNNFQQLLSYTSRYKSSGLYAAYDDKNTQIAQAFLIKSNKRLFLLHYSTLPDDKKFIGPMAIIYHIVKNNAESDLTLSFSFDPKQLGESFTKDEHVCGVYRRKLYSY